MTDLDKTFSLVNQVWPPLQESLRELRLEQLLPDVQTIVAECVKQQMSVENTLRAVFGVALQRRQNHRQEMQLTMARFPTPATFENFDFTKIDQHSQQSLTALANWVMFAYRCDGMELVERRIIRAQDRGGLPPKHSFASIPRA